MLALLTGALSLARPPQVIAPAADPTAVTPAAPAAAAVTPTAPVAGAVTPPPADPAAVTPTAPVSGAVTPPVADPAAATPPVVDPAAGAPADPASDVVRLDALGFDDKGCSSSSSVLVSNPSEEEVNDDVLSDGFLLGFELRWSRGGRFDGVYLQPAAAAVVASAPPCELAVASAISRARSIAAQLAGGVLAR